MSQGFWRLDGQSALLSCGALEARIDVARPDRGLCDLQVLGAPLAGAHLLAVETPRGANFDPAAIDVYERGADLVATYAASEAWPFRLQIYWRVWIGPFAPAIAAVELIVSVQTHLLDAAPRMAAVSRLPSADVYQLVDADRGHFLRREIEPADAVRDRELPPQVSRLPPPIAACDCTLFRPSEAPWTYGEMTHPRGAVSSRLVADDGLSATGSAGPGESAASGWRLSHQLFAERLEKGVILRARVLAALVDRGAERRGLASIYRDYAASDPPLTT